MPLSAQQRIEQRLAEQRMTTATGVPIRRMKGETEAAVVPGGWFGGWLGVVPYWHYRRWDEDADDRRGVMGVTDGTEARPGEVGEWVRFQTTVNYTTAGQVQSVNLGVLPAGDWDCWASSTTSTAVSGLAIVLSPQPDGFTGDLGAANIVLGAAEGVTIVSNTERALTTAVSLIAFRVTINDWGTAGPQAGYAIVRFSARRRR